VASEFPGWSNPLPFIAIFFLQNTPFGSTSLHSIPR
jgi:hypothetical protein